MDDSNIKSYEAADSALHDKRTGKSAQSRKLRPNTYLQRRYETVANWVDTQMPIEKTSAIAIRLHNTDIVTFRNDGSIELNTGGWFTVTTKDRMNRYLPEPFCIFSKKGSWHVSLSWAEERQHSESKIAGQHICDVYCYDRKEIATSAPYFDGIILDPATATVVNGSEIPDERARDKRNDEMRRKIRNYVRRYSDERIRELLAKAQVEGTSGECWFCALYTTEESKPLGEATKDNGHLLNHIDEGYLMASLLHYAIRASGRRDPAFVMAYAPDLARHDLSKYLRKRLLEATMVNH